MPVDKTAELADLSAIAGLHGVKVPAGVKSVVVEATDRQFGYGGKTVEVALPRR